MRAFRAQQGGRGRDHVQLGLPGLDQIAHGLLRRDPRMTRRADVQVLVNDPAIRVRQLAVDVRRDEGVDRSTIRHFFGGPYPSTTPTGRRWFNRWNSKRRPREIRDMTVPIGIDNIPAISA